MLLSGVAARRTDSSVHGCLHLRLEEGLSKREFFEKYGFVLMPHKTQMTAEDWLYCGPNPPVLEASSQKKGIGAKK